MHLVVDSKTNFHDHHNYLKDWLLIHYLKERLTWGLGNSTFRQHPAIIFKRLISKFTYREYKQNSTMSIV